MLRRLVAVVSCAAVLAVAIAVAPLAGQTGRVWVEPRVGWLVPTRDLGRTDIVASAGFGVFERADQSAVLGLGAGVELGSRLALRAAVDRSLDATVVGEWKCVPFVGCPDVLLPLEGELSRWTTVIDVLYRPATPFPVEPVVFAGFGLQRNQLGWNQPEADVTLPAFSFSETEPVYRLGVGAERSLGRVKLFGEVDATAVRFGGGLYESIEGNVAADRTLSVDMGFVGGVRIRLW
jgi:hypothetical protein